ncbi:TonB-dependent receptor-like protein [Arcticibacter tournemirensis]|uniref:TonB-dependent receptor plug domain-containing protein n=1 Tax=Arcticibacter tournemirensis TaxID=699437 RepID=A0A5M9H9H7_9SPHI|nr:TonB-dependent receptor [Arcticibacter tournemirensis]KAA8483572.1 TonB-dependent receptor plug domain-containing protein [Arcticibacter tournemirensis]TQM51477.1 TonB-dependent receptor-like protein [Arcticibacter tournemirensis]
MQFRIRVITQLFGCFIALLLSSVNVYAQGNNLILVSGHIIDNDNKQSLEGVSVHVKGTVGGTITNAQGEFNLKTKAKYPFSLVFSSVGFQTQEFLVTGPESKLNIALVTQTMLGKEVVVTASKVEESILRSPVAIEKLDIRSIRESPAPGFYDALENMKGVQMTTSSLTFKIPNTRGFNIPSNYRFMQLVDGTDMQAATLGVPLGNAVGPTELDIASVEITPGAASALYGMNAINGMSNLLTKSPFLYQGLSIYQKTGFNHTGGTGRELSNLTETSIRYAKAFNNKWAFKINASYLRGTDWLSDTRLDQNPNSLKTANPSFPELNGSNNAVFDGWNKYGDDALAGSNTVSVTGLTINGQANQTLTVARTGYWEKDLVNPTVDNLKFDAALHYRLNDRVELSYSYRVGKMDGVFQRGNKIQLDNVVVQNHKLDIKGSNFLIRSYMSIEDSGDSYNVKPLADNLDLASGGSGSVWSAKFKTALNAYATANGGSLTSENLAAATQYARQAADASRVEPGTKAFDDLKNIIRRTNNWDIKSAQIPDAPETGGAALVQNSRLYHTEAQWDLSEKTKVFDLLIGGDARVYEIIPDGNSFVDFDRPIEERNKQKEDGSYGDNVYYKKFGAFTQVTKTLFDDKLKLFGSVRFDYNPEFDPKFTPRLAAVYTLKENHNFRFTFQEGYRFPALFEALSYVNNGRVKRVGSLSYINEGLGYLDNSYTQTSVVNFNAAVKAAGNTDAAALANRALLQVANLPKARPERIVSFEAGYKSILLNNKLVLDIDAYMNEYDGFLGQVQVFVPKGETVGSDAAVIAMIDRNRDATTASGANAASKGQDRYRVYTNAKNTYHNYGSAFSTTYNFYKKYTVAGNVSFNKMKANETSDIFVTGFNTPEWSANVSFGNREIVKNLGFSIVYRWQQSFLWESPLVTGEVAAVNTFDAQTSFRIPESKATIKVGASNIFNKKYIQYAGGPTLGGLYYAAITFDGLLTK